MFPGRYPGRLVRHGPTRTHKRIRAVGSGGKGRPRPPVPRPSPRPPAVVRVQPPPAFTVSGMPKARKGSTEKPEDPLPLLPNPVNFGRQFSGDSAIVSFVPAHGVEHESPVADRMVFQRLAPDEVVRNFF